MPPGEALAQVVTHEDSQTSTTRGKQLAGLMLLAAWFGLVTGLGEVFIQNVKGFLANRQIDFNQHSAWMAPVADFLIFTIIGLLLFLLARRWPKLISPRAVAFVFTFLGFLSLLFRITWLASYAALPLAAGLAVQMSRYIAAHDQGFRRFARRSIVWVVAIVAGLGVSVYGWQEMTERRALAKLPPPPADAPNVLLIVLDTVRAENLSLYGYNRPTTPNLEQFARRGVVFERAVSAASWTVPSHASMFTGRYLHELPVGWTRLTDADPRYPALAETLSAHGYTTVGFVANLIGCDHESGLNRGFARYEDYPVSLGQIILSSSLGRTITSSSNSTKIRRIIGRGDQLNRKTAEIVNNDFLSWLSTKGERPFFAFINYFDAHSPYLPPEPFDEKFGPRPKPKAMMKLSNYLDALTTDGAVLLDKDITQRQLQAQFNAYDGAIAYIDHHLGQLFEELERRGVLENTLVIITADHGEEFGEHGVFGHGFNLHWLPLHVPLLVSHPSRVPAGKVVREPVSLRDIAATVVDLLKIDGMAPYPGNSLARQWDGTAGSGGTMADAALSEIGGHAHDSRWPGKSLVVGRYHYIKNGEGREMLYDIENDPFEKQDLAQTEEGRRVCERFRNHLDTIFASNRR